MITFEQVMDWDPCYSQERVEALFAGREVLTLADVFDLDISAEHKLWVLLREELIPAPVLHEFACCVAEQALALLTNPDPRSVAAIAAKRAWLKGEITNEQLSEAREAAKAAAWAAAMSAASAAAWFAAGDTARDTVRAAGGAAAWFAARAAAGAAARAATVSAAKYAARAAVEYTAWATSYMTACIAQLELLQTLLKETAQETA